MTQTKKPLIGLTTVQNFTNPTYTSMISAMGGLPVLLTENPEVVSSLDGLVIIGGQDVDPILYKAKPEVVYQEMTGKGQRYLRPMDYAPNRKRDDFEIALYHAAKVKKIPILGICRGLQLINIAEGGTLYEELPESNIFHEAGLDGWAPGHFIRIESGTKTHQLLQVEQYVMSSRHHQGIEHLGKNLKASAWSEDGLIEIFEWGNDEQWIFGVQGHIEQTRHNFPVYDKLVADFIKHGSKASEPIQKAV